jgi:hypothetical protein
MAGHLDSMTDLNLRVAALCLSFGSPGLRLSLPFGLPPLPIVWAVDPESFHLGASFDSSRRGFGLAFGSVRSRLSLSVSHDLFAITRTIHPCRIHLGPPLNSASVGFGLAFDPTRFHLGLPLGMQLVELTRRSAQNHRTGGLSIRGTRHERRHRECAQKDNSRCNE